MSAPNEPAASRVRLAGSELTPLTGSRKGDPVDPSTDLSVSVYLRPAEPITPELVTELAPGAAFTREEFATRFGSRAEDLATVATFAAAHGLRVDSSDAARRVVVLGGPAAAMRSAFGVELATFEHADGSYRGFEGAITVPADLGTVIQSVHGLDDRPVAHAQFRTLAARPGAAGGGHSPVEIGKAYNFPTTATGAGQCVAIIELGGGYTQSDLQKFFSDNGIVLPTVVSVGVDGATNAPGDPADGEVALDIEVIGALAPGARIAVYFAPNTDQGFIDAVTTAAHDKTNAPSVMSISWGQAESGWSAATMQQMDQAFQAALLLGVTAFAASGDNGSGDSVTDGLAHVDFPASSPHAVGCGGTTLAESGGTISNETVWDSATGGTTGGGVSDTFPLPSYQSGVGVPPSANPGGHVGRGVPDVAGDADPATGYDIVLGGTTQTFGGTSAVAPLWSALIALVNSDLGRAAGFIHPLLYARPAAFHDVVSGGNGAYQAGPGWDACTGLGSPNGMLVRDALAAQPGP
ncbi:MAG TPA: S53 family peptidase [Solirubrobacteraceae bacterium]|nr:S53 family peptidase [Solirubrobacteraceae bacterium]